MGLAASSEVAWEFKNGRAVPRTKMVAKPTQRRKLFRNQLFKNDNFDDYILKNKTDRFPRANAKPNTRRRAPPPNTPGRGRSLFVDDRWNFKKRMEEYRRTKGRG